MSEASHPRVRLRCRWLPGRFGVYRLPASAPVPDWAGNGAFTTVSRSADELSVLCTWVENTGGLPAIGPLVCFAVVGPLDFSLTGVLARLTGALAASDVSVFSVATHDTDYVLVAHTDESRAQRALESAGIVFLDAS